jgi:hypothetical protein
MAIMPTPKKYQSSLPIINPAAAADAGLIPDAFCDSCGQTENLHICDSDFGPYSIVLCADCLDPDFDPGLNHPYYDAEFYATRYVN